VTDRIGDAFAGLRLDDVGHGLWEPALPYLAKALSGGDRAPFLQALEGSARGAGLSQSASLASLLEAYVRGARGLREALGDAGSDAGSESRALVELEGPAALRIASGYAAGLEETIVDLRRRATEASPIDSHTGALKPETIVDRLSLEVNRCQRMDLPLGLLEIALDEAAPEARAGVRGEARGALPAVGECLRDNVRQYDAIGLTADGSFLVVLPDISRRGLTGAAERLRRLLAASGGREHALAFVFALAHYDYVDLNAGEMLHALKSSMRQARRAHASVIWS
jgi:GGDEF domain-containing protein